MQRKHFVMGGYLAGVVVLGTFTVNAVVKHIQQGNAQEVMLWCGAMCLFTLVYILIAHRPSREDALNRLAVWLRSRRDER
jgi:hypothetical protein